MKKKVLSLVLSASMVSSMLPAMAYAADGTTTFPDMPNDWSTTALQSAIDNGLLNGIDGKIAASENLTRAQMAAIVTRAFGTNGNADISGFGDVNSGDWFYNAMAAAVNMGAFQGDGTGLNPNANITRQEAFTVLARLFTLSGADQSVLNSFSDAGQVADWAKDSMASMVQAGYVSGDRNMLKPTSSITRAEFAQVMYNLLSDYMVAGEDGTNVQGNAILNQTGTLSNVTVSGDLIVGDGAGEGDVTLNNVTVSGRLLVRGGGVNTVTLEGNTTVGGQIVVNKPTGDVRVHNSTSNEFDAAVISDGATLTGEFDVVEVTAFGTTTVTGATVNTVNVSAAASLSVAGESKVDTVNLDAASSKLNVNGNSTVTTVNVPESASNASIDVANGSTVTNVNTAANGVSIDGEGKVSNVKVEGNNTSVDTVGTKVTVASGVTGTTSNGKDIAAGTTVTTTANGTTGGGSTGGSSDTGDNGETPVVDKAYKVSIGTFVGGKVTADITETDEANQTITLTVTPDAQNGETMPYVLKAESLKVTLGTGEEATDVEVTPGDNNTYTFTMDTEGTYTVTAEFVQPITKAEVFVIDNVESLKSLVTKGYVADEEELKNNFADPNGGTVNGELQANPWLAFGILRNTDFSTAKIEKLDVKQNGVSVTNNSHHFPSLSGKAASAMLKGARPEFQDKDYLGFTHDYGTYDVTFTCEGAEYSFTTDYYPEGEGITYNTVTFVVDGETYKTYKGQATDTITAPEAPAKIGYTFDDWYDADGNEMAVDAKYDADKTYTAKYNVNQYTIAFDPNDGTGEMASIENVKYDADTTLTKNTFTRDGYTFAGWNTQADGQGTAYADEATVKNLTSENNATVTLYAQWTAQTSEVSTTEEFDTALKANIPQILVKGNEVVVSSEVTIPEGTTVTVDKDAVLSVGAQTRAEAKLNVAGTLNIAEGGKVAVNSGSVEVTDSGSVAVTGTVTIAANATLTAPDAAVELKAGAVLTNDGTVTGAVEADEKATIDGANAKQVSKVEASAATFAPMIQAIYDAGYVVVPGGAWEGKPEKIEQFGSLTYAAPDTEGKVVVTGTANKVVGFTGFNKTEEAEQSGYYAVFQVEAPEDVATGTSTVIGHIGDKEITVANMDKDGEKSYLNCIIWLADKNATEVTKTTILKIDWDGADAGKYTESTYTLDFSGVELDSSVVAPKNATALKSEEFNGFPQDGYKDYLLKVEDEDFPLVSDTILFTGKLGEDGKVVNLSEIVEHVDGNCPVCDKHEVGKTCMLSQSTIDEKDDDNEKKHNVAWTLSDETTAGTWYFWTADGVYSFTLPVSE